MYFVVLFLFAGHAFFYVLVICIMSIHMCLYFMQYQ